MKKTCKSMIGASILSITLLLSACTNTNPGAMNANRHDNDNNMTNVSHHAKDNGRDLHDPSIIPSETGDKQRTTNIEGTTYSGMGQNIYSSIGSSTIHEGGVSSYFESILKGEGITGVKVFVVDDSVVLARKKAETTNHEYDNMQRNLLSGTEGLSGKGEPKGISDTKDNNHDNLHQAKKYINEMFNGNVKILTVTNEDAPNIIEQIKDNIKASDYTSAADHLQTLLNMAKE